MAIKDLAVGYDGNLSSRTALRFAIQMGRKYAAAVTALHVPVEVRQPSHVKRWLPQDVLDQLKRGEEEAHAAVRASFGELIKASGFDGRAEFYSETGVPNVLLPRLSRYHDLLLIGQFTQAFASDANVLDPEELVLRLGKPVVIVPRELEIAPFKEEAVIAWDGSRQASRALTDAMQILETKKRLDVVTVTVADGEASDLGLQGRDLISHLQRHGINAKHVQLNASRKSGIAAAILGYCAETKPDLLVTGAFGRNKIGSRLFGGVTQSILKEMMLPVLMSH